MCPLVPNRGGSLARLLSNPVGPGSPFSPSLSRWVSVPPCSPSLSGGSRLPLLAVPYPGGSRFPRCLSRSPLPPEPTRAVGVAFYGGVSGGVASRAVIIPVRHHPGLRHHCAPPLSVRDRHVLVGVPAWPGCGRPGPAGELRAGKRRAGLRPAGGERGRLGWAPSCWGWVSRDNLGPGMPLPGAGLSLGKGHCQLGAGRGGGMRGRLEQMPENRVR